MNRGIAVRGKSLRDIEKAAARARGALLPEVRPSSQISAIDLFERVLEERGAQLTGREVIVAVSTLPHGLEANTQYLEERRAFQLELSDSTYRSVEACESRALFTLGHEIGHLALHASDLQYLKRLPEPALILARNSSKHRIYEDSEWQADAFSAAFIMPAPALETMFVNGGLTVDAVCRRFGTSLTAAERRITKFHDLRPQLVMAWTPGAG